MKVLYFSRDYTPHDYRFLKKLSESAYDVHYLRLEANPVPMESRPPPSRVNPVDWLGNRSYRLRGRGRLRLFRDFRRVMKDLRPDLVHAGPVQTCGFFTALSGFNPFLLMSWGSDVLREADRGPINRCITRFTLRRADMAMADCLAVREKMVRLGYPDEKIIVFPWGVDLFRFGEGAPTLRLREKLGWKNKKVVINTRSLEPIYGIEVFLRASLEVVRKEPMTRFLMAGDGSLMASVKDFLSRNCLEQYFHLAGRVPNHEIPSYFKEADLYVSCSYSDGTSVSLLEAMASKLPVVVTDLPSNREWVTPGENGWLVPAGDSGALASAILEALGRKETARNMGSRNLASVRQKADWDKNSDLLIEAYGKLVRKTA